MDMKWKLVKEFNDEDKDVNVRITLSDKGIYSYHIGRSVDDHRQSRHFGIFIVKKTRKINNSRIESITRLVTEAETWIQEQLDLLR
jgi:hypothetical protein